MEAATPFNTPYVKRVIRWEQLSDYLSSPLSLVQQATAGTRMRSNTTS